MIDTGDDLIDNVISIKLPSGKHKAKADFDKLDLMKRLPDDNASGLQNFLESEDSISNDVKKARSNYIRAEIKYTDLRTGEEIKIPPSTFRTKIRPSYNHNSSDFIKIESETLGTTREDLLENSYQTFKNKLTQ